MSPAKAGERLSASDRLEQLAREAIVVSKKAKRHKKSLAGGNFYGNKLATLRSDATNAFRELAPTSAGDSSAIAELLEEVFSPTVDARKRAAATQELATTFGRRGALRQSRTRMKGYSR